MKIKLTGTEVNRAITTYVKKEILGVCGAAYQGKCTVEYSTGEKAYVAHITTPEDIKPEADEDAVDA